MNFTYDTHGTKTYLVYEITSEDVLDAISLGMLTNNSIQGLAQTIFNQLDNSKFIKYNISSKVSVRQFFTSTVKRKQLVGVFIGIVDAMLSAEDYMIAHDMLMLDLDYIYADVSSYETILICLPIVRSEASCPDLLTFFKEIMFNTQFDQSENCSYVAKIISHLNGSKVFSLTDFRKMLLEIKNGDEIKRAPVVQPSVAQSAPPQIEKYNSSQPVQPQTTPVTSASPVSQVVAEYKNPSEPKQEVKNPFKAPTAPAPAPSNLPRRPIKSPERTETASVTAGAEKISLFYLLQHYNKENAALYKAQQEAAKAEKPQKEATPKKKTGGKPGKTVTPNESVGFLVPGRSETAPKPQSPVQTNMSIPSQPQVTSYTPEVSSPQAPSPVESRGQAAGFGDTTILGGGGIGETTVLGADKSQDQVQLPFLLRERNNERILLNKPVFRIGKERSYVDYFIGDNSAISRSHANIVMRDGDCFIIDTNSTNHTFINGSMIQSNVETKLEHGDKVMLANEVLEFRKY